MQRISWSDLGAAVTDPAVAWIQFRIPTTLAEWDIGPLVKAHRRGPPPLRADEILIDAHQNANMTLSRRVPFQCVLKALMRACTIVEPRMRLNMVIGHIKLERYRFRSLHGDDSCAALVDKFVVLVWVLGVPTPLIE
jgi:hypothetical protein